MQSLQMLGTHNEQNGQTPCPHGTAILMRRADNIQSIFSGLDGAMEKDKAWSRDGCLE